MASDTLSRVTFSLGVIYRELTSGDPRTRLPALAVARAQASDPLSAGCLSALTDFCSTSENTFGGMKQTLTARMNLWLNPRICAATDASDFDLRSLRDRRISLYLCVSPDNLARVAPLYSLLLQQLVELNVRERPAGERHGIPVLLLLDEFARLGHASVIAHGFAPQLPPASSRPGPRSGSGVRGSFREASQRARPSKSSS